MEVVIAVACIASSSVWWQALASNVANEFLGLLTEIQHQQEFFELRQKRDEVRMMKFLYIFGALQIDSKSGQLDKQIPWDQTLKVVQVTT